MTEIVSEEKRDDRGMTASQEGLPSRLTPSPQGNGDDKEDREDRPVDDRIRRMGTGRIPPLVREFAIPAIAGMMVNGAYQLIDSVFLGWGAPDVGLATITVAGPMMTIIMALSMLVGAGGNALCALRLGEGKRDEAERVLGNTLALAIIVSVIVAVLTHIQPIMDIILTFSSSTPEVRPYATMFIKIVSLGCILFIVGGGINNFIRTAGAPNRALLTMVIGAVGCTVFNAIFVLGMGMGVMGSALATIIGQALSCISVLWYFIKTPNVPLRLRLDAMKLEGHRCAKIVALGMASFTIQMGSAAFMFANNYVLVKYGAMSFLGATAALQVSGVIGRVTMFVVLPLIGMSIAVQPLLGFNYGAKLWWRVRKTLFVGMKANIVIGAVLWILLMAFASQVAVVFGITDPDLRSFTAMALRVSIIWIPLVGAQIVGANYFQATGQPTKSIILSLTRQILFLVPALLIMPVLVPTLVAGFDPVLAIFLAIPVSDVLAAVVTLSFVAIELRKINRRIKENPLTCGDPKAHSDGTLDVA